MEKSFQDALLHCMKHSQICHNFLVTQLAFTCSRSIMETPEQCGNLFKVNNKDTIMTSLMSFHCLHCKRWIDFTYCSGVSMVHFEQVNGSCESLWKRTNFRTPGSVTYISLKPLYFPIGNCIFKVNDNSTGTRCEICLELIIKTPKQRHWRRSSVIIFNFEHISHLVLMLLLLTLTR